MKKFTWWLNTFINGINESTDETAKRTAFEKCGRACFQSCDITETIKDCKKNTHSIDELLAELNKNGIGGGNLKVAGNTISGIYEKCYCPFRCEMGDRLSPEFCNCTLGWAKSFFEIVLDRPFEVELVQAIGRGDRICKFTAEIK